MGVTQRRGRKEKRHSMIMYELSAVLYSGEKECSGAFKKKIIMSSYSNTSANNDFHWSLVLCPGVNTLIRRGGRAWDEMAQRNPIK